VVRDAGNDDASEPGHQRGVAMGGGVVK
jgi:hypothetical protein